MKALLILQRLFILMWLHLKLDVEKRVMKIFKPYNTTLATAQPEIPPGRSIAGYEFG